MSFNAQTIPELDAIVISSFQIRNLQPRKFIRPK